jgi:hypothetical protein
MAEVPKVRMMEMVVAAKVIRNFFRTGLNSIFFFMV